MKKNLLIIAIGFLPNIGGLETHLKDLTDELIKHDWRVMVLTYQPLNTPVLGKWIERKRNLTIFRLPILRGWYYKFLKYPILEFLYLGPLLFLFTPLVLLKYPDVKTVNAQGVIAGFSAAFWTRLFNKRYVVSVQSAYNFPKKGLYRKISQWIFNCADKIIAISTHSKKDIQTLDVNGDKVVIYTNWEDLNKYKVIDKDIAKKKIGYESRFIVSFFGRLVEEKGILVLLDAIKSINDRITFLIYGEGPLEKQIMRIIKNITSTYFMGTIQLEELNLHYAAADLVIMPSLHEEGFGRVASGALLSGTPVIASNKGALPEVVDDSVGRIINPTPKNIADSIEFFYSHKEQLKKRALNARKYAMRKFSNKNAEVIIRTYLPAS